MKPLYTNISEFFKFVGLKIGTILIEGFLFIITFFAPTGYIMLAVGFSVLVDTYFGRWKARHKNEKVTSKSTRIGITNKSIGYMLVVLGAFLVDKAFMNEIVAMFFEIEFAVTKGVGLIFCWIEYTSVNESYEEVKGKSIAQSFRDMLKGVKVVKDDLRSVKKKNEGEK